MSGTDVMKVIHTQIKITDVKSAIFYFRRRKPRAVTLHNVDSPQDTTSIQHLPSSGKLPSTQTEQKIKTKTTSCEKAKKNFAVPT